MQKGDHWIQYSINSQEELNITFASMIISNVGWYHVHEFIGQLINNMLETGAFGAALSTKPNGHAKGSHVVLDKLTLYTDK